LRIEEEKSSDISGNVEVQEIGVEDLKDDDKVVWHTDLPRWGKFDFEVDSGFIKRFGKVMKEHQAEVKLAIVGGTIVAVVLEIGIEQLRKRRR